jgi:hypothetical protein
MNESKRHVPLLYTSNGPSQFSRRGKGGQGRNKSCAQGENLLLCQLGTMERNRWQTLALDLYLLQTPIVVGIGCLARSGSFSQHMFGSTLAFS